VDSAGSFCQAGRWGPAGRDELVYVRCFDAAGVPSDTRFTVLFTRSSGLAPAGAHAYVFASNTGVLVDSFSSTGGANAVTWLATGLYRVHLPNLAPGTYAGDLQITAAVDSPRRCRVADWAQLGTDYTVYVGCTDEAGAKADSWFTLSYHHKRAVFGSLAPPRNLGYVLFGSPAPMTNYNPVTGSNVVVPTAVGTWDVTYPGIGVYPNHLQVTAYSGTLVYCQLYDVWTVTGPDAVAQVACFAPGGTPVNSSFFATYSSSI
jgi:hypothetical protein